MLKALLIKIARTFKMNGRGNVRLTLLFVGLTSLVLLSVSESANALPIGPGSHWVDSAVVSAQDSFASIMVFGVDITLDGIPEFDATFFGGPGTTIVNRSEALDDSLTFPGLEPLDGHMDVIDTEIISMNLTGTGAATGWTLRAGTTVGLAQQTLGAVAEQPGDNTLADSFFDVFFEIDGTPFGTLHNNTALLVEAVVDRLPPIGIDYNANNLLESPLPMYDEQNVLRANLTELTTGGTGHHTPIPEPATMLLLGTGLVGIAGFRRKNRKGHLKGDIL